jgi:hypothetical protein
LAGTPVRAALPPGLAGAYALASAEANANAAASSMICSKPTTDTPDFFMFPIILALRDPDLI